MTNGNLIEKMCSFLLLIKFISGPHLSIQTTFSQQVFVLGLASMLFTSIYSPKKTRVNMPLTTLEPVLGHGFSESEGEMI